VPAWTDRRVSCEGRPGGIVVDGDHLVFVEKNIRFSEAKTSDAVLGRAAWGENLRGKNPASMVYGAARNRATPIRW